MQTFNTQNIDYDSIDKNELQKYKTILEMTNAHLGDTKQGATFRLLAELNLETLLQIYFQNQSCNTAKVGNVLTWLAICTTNPPSHPRSRA